MDFQAAETDRREIVQFEAPAQESGRVHVVGGEAGLLECGLDAVALPGGERGGAQARQAGRLRHLLSLAIPSWAWPPLCRASRTVHRCWCRSVKRLPGRPSA